MLLQRLCIKKARSDGAAEIAGNMKKGLSQTRFSPLSLTNIGFLISLRKPLPPVTLRYGSPPSPVGTALHRAFISLTFPLWDTFLVLRLMTLLDTGNLQ